MGDNPFKKCINPTCNLTYEINNNILVCKCGSFLDIIYQKNFSRELIQTFYQRRNHGGNIYNESGVWRFRELINFANLIQRILNNAPKFWFP
jgi:threonine synthase